MGNFGSLPHMDGIGLSVGFRKTGVCGKTTYTVQQKISQGVGRNGGCRRVLYRSHKKERCKLDKQLCVFALMSAPRLSPFPGCGSGKYLSVNPLVFNVGSDRCLALAKIARKKDHEVCKEFILLDTHTRPPYMHTHFQILYCDNLCLPFRDESLDAVLSVAVIHHVATVERRVRALREIARALRVGGRVIISVWAMEQRHRKVGEFAQVRPQMNPPTLDVIRIPSSSPRTSSSLGTGPQRPARGERRPRTRRARTRRPRPGHRGRPPRRPRHQYPLLTR